MLFLLFFNIGIWTVTHFRVVKLFIKFLIIIGIWIINGLTELVIIKVHIYSRVIVIDNTYRWWLICTRLCIMIDIAIVFIEILFIVNSIGGKSMKLILIFDSSTFIIPNLIVSLTIAIQSIDWTINRTHISNWRVIGFVERFCCRGKLTIIGDVLLGSGLQKAKILNFILFCLK